MLVRKEDADELMSVFCNAAGSMWSPDGCACFCATRSTRWSADAFALVSENNTISPPRTRGILWALRQRGGYLPRK